MYLFSGLLGMIAFLCISLIAKSFLEAINYIEHYGLVRAPGSPVESAHSWNSNHYLSSIYLCNVTMTSSHHEKSSLIFMMGRVPCNIAKINTAQIMIRIP